MTRSKFLLFITIWNTFDGSRPSGCAIIGFVLCWRLTLAFWVHSTRRGSTWRTATSTKKWSATWWATTSSSAPRTTSPTWWPSTASPSTITTSPSAVPPPCGATGWAWCTATRSTTCSAGLLTQPAASPRPSSASARASWATTGTLQPLGQFYTHYPLMCVLLVILRCFYSLFFASSLNEEKKCMLRFFSNYQLVFSYIVAKNNYLYFNVPVISNAHNIKWILLLAGDQQSMKNHGPHIQEPLRSFSRGALRALGALAWDPGQLHAHFGTNSCLASPRNMVSIRRCRKYLIFLSIIRKKIIRCWKLNSHLL